MSSLILLSQTQLDLGEVWLKQMGEAARRYGTTIQYINSVPPFINYNDYYHDHVLGMPLPLLILPMFSNHAGTVQPGRGMLCKVLRSQQ